jgi:hypothetical protein
MSGMESDFSNEITNVIPASVTNRAPSIAPIADVTVEMSYSPTTVLFRVSDPDTPLENLVVTASSTNTTLVPNHRIWPRGTADQRILRIQPTPDLKGTTLITVVVSDGSKASTTSFLLTIAASLNLDPIPDPPLLQNDTTTHVISLTGIRAGLASRGLPLTVTASSSNPEVIPSPTVQYTSPNSMGRLLLFPKANVIGTALITVVLTDAGSNQVSRSFNVSLLSTNTLTPYTIWQYRHFGWDIRRDPAQEATVWGDEANPDHDALPNLAEYALGGDPMLREIEWDGLQSSLVERNGQYCLAMSFLKRKSEPTLRYRAETQVSDSEQWSVWMPPEADFQMSSNIDAEFEAVTFLVPGAVDTNQWRRFRLIIEALHDGITNRYISDTFQGSAELISGETDGFVRLKQLSIRLISPVRYTGKVTAVGADCFQDT